MTEIWKPVPTWEDFYEVSNIGRLRSFDRITGGPFGTTRRTKGRLLKQQIVKGYPHVCLKDKTRVKNEYIHTLVLLAFVGKRESYEEACHNDGNRLNNNLSNLRWDTLAANKSDMVKHGTSTKGAKNPNAKIDQATADAIRYHRSAYGTPYSRLGVKYGMSPGNAHAICSGKLWKK